jgi:hypothetical protein
MKPLHLFVVIAAAVLTLAISVGGAEAHTFTYNLQLKIGDVDCDGDMDSVDALKIQRYLVGLPVSQNEPCPNINTWVTYTKLSDNSHWDVLRFGDVDVSDGNVNALDAQQILNCVAQIYCFETTVHWGPPTDAETHYKVGSNPWIYIPPNQYDALLTSFY